MLPKSGILFKLTRGGHPREGPETRVKTGAEGERTLKTIQEEKRAREAKPGRAEPKGKRQQILKSFARAWIGSRAFVEGLNGRV